MTVMNNYEAALSDIPCSDILLGILHAYGLAISVKPTNSTMYRNAYDAVVGGDLFAESGPLPSDGLTKEKSWDPYLRLDEEMERNNAPESVQMFILGACSVLGRPGISARWKEAPSSYTYGAYVAMKVIERENIISMYLINTLTGLILADQTELVRRFCGGDNDRYYWLVEPRLFRDLLNQGEIILRCGDQMWWEMDAPLDPINSPLSANKTLLNIANTSIKRRW